MTITSKKEIINATRETINATNDYHMSQHSSKNGRRGFLKKTALGSMALGGLFNLSFEDTIAQTTAGVRRTSAPSDLKITDMRYAVVQNVGRTAILRIDTNQGIYGL